MTTSAEEEFNKKMLAELERQAFEASQKAAAEAAKKKEEKN